MLGQYLPVVWLPLTSISVRTRLGMLSINSATSSWSISFKVGLQPVSQLTQRVWLSWRAALFSFEHVPHVFSRIQIRASRGPRNRSEPSSRISRAWACDTHVTRKVQNDPNRVNASAFRFLCVKSHLGNNPNSRGRNWMSWVSRLYRVPNLCGISDLEDW